MKKQVAAKCNAKKWDSCMYAETLGIEKGK